MEMSKMTFSQRVTRTAGCALAIAGLAWTHAARADVQFVTEMRMGGANEKPLSTTTTFRKDGAERIETRTQLGAAEQHSVVLMLCDKRQMITFDPALKIFYETPMVKSETEVSTEKKEKETKGKDKATGTITMTLVSLRALDDQKVGAATAKCYEVVTRMQSSGCAGDSDVTTKQEICVAENESLGSGGCSDYQAPSNSGGDGENPCKITFVRKGDWTLYNKIMSQRQVRTRSFLPEGKVSMESQSKIVSRAKLSDDLFVVPADYEKVTEQEFQKAQSKAMMDKLMAGMKLE